MLTTKQTNSYRIEFLFESKNIAYFDNDNNIDLTPKLVIFSIYVVNKKISTDNIAIFKRLLLGNVLYVSIYKNNKPIFSLSFR